jgi:uncharacterized phage protein gp47/JayE
MTALTDKGFTRDDLATILANMTTDVLRIYPDASLDASTQDGQLLGVFSNAIDQLGQVVQAVYDSMSPSQATGVTLARIAEYNGIRIINGTQSQGTVSFIGNPQVTVPMNTQIQCTANGSLFYTVADCILDTQGLGSVGVLSELVGAISAPAGTLTKLMMPVYSVRSVTNTSDVLIGKDRETDQALRVRRSYSVATPSQSILEGIKGAVANIAQVIQVETYENKTDLTDANGLPPHSFSVVVEGGDDNDIAAAIFLREPVGANQYGNTTVTVDDKYGNPHPITFLRPPVVSIFMRIELTTLYGWTDDLIAQMQTNIVEWSQANWLIGVPVVTSQLYIPINAVGTSFAVSRILIGTTAQSLAVVEMIPIAFKEIAKTNTASITIVKV